jgi:hypothetical protein
MPHMTPLSNPACSGLASLAADATVRWCRPVNQSSSLHLQIAGRETDGVNPGWEGTLAASDSFAVLLLVSTPGITHWAKAEPAHHSGLPISLHCHPLREARDFQLLYVVGSAWITSLCGTVVADRAVPTIHLPAEPCAGVLLPVASVPSEPPMALALFVLSRSDVSVARGGIWRPHKALQSHLPPALLPALFGSRQGSFPTLSTT